MTTPTTRNQSTSTRQSAAEPAIRPASAGTSRSRADVGRLGTLTRMELTLLGRNRTTLFNAIALAPGMVLVMLGVIDDRVGDAGQGVLAGTILTTLLGFGLLFIVYYNLTTTAVARREELTLKRLTTGEVTRGQILVGMSVPATLIVLAQLAAGLAVLAFAFDLPPMTNPVLLVVTLALALAAFATLGYASSGLTRTVESAQLTTLPLLAVATLFSGLTVPLSAFPDRLQTVAELTPLAPVVQLMGLSVNGLGPDGDPVTFASSFEQAAMPLAVLAAWVVVGLIATQRWMRWEPRR